MRPFPFRKKWSNAVRTACDCGRVHASKGEQRVCAALLARVGSAGLLQQVRFPLLWLGPQPDGTPHTICVDFVTIERPPTVVGEEPAAPPKWEAWDAKCRGRVSRDWPARAAAFRLGYGRPIREVWVDESGRWKEA